MFIEGIRHVSADDIRFAEQLGYRIKLLGIASRTDHGIEQRVHPCMVKQSTPIAHVDGVFNAVVAEGDCVGRSIYEGRGAGAGPTASAVAADIVDIARGTKVPTFGVPVDALKAETPAAMDRRFGAYYLRLMVLDKPGVLADVANALRDENISVEQMIQPGRKPGEVVPMVMTLHETEEAAMNRAAARIAKFEAVVEPPRFIRIENL
jgi:homoserine dehydrogenase